MAVFAAILLLLVLLLSFSMLHLPLYAALALGLIPFIVLARYQQTSWNILVNGLISGLFKLSKTYQILLLIGAATALWMACGTLPYLVHAGVGIIHPRLFLLLVFLLTWAITLLLGSALGAAGMVGALFMAMARVGHYSLAMTAGAVVSAIYLGERSSPLSSCANLVADITSQPVIKYIKTNIRHSAPSLIITILIYTGLSLAMPLTVDSNQLQNAIEAQFSLSPLVLIPIVVLVLGLILTKKITVALILSILSATLTAYLVQGQTLDTLFTTALMGYHLPETSPLAHSLKANGALGMLTPLLTVMASALYSGIFEATSLLKPIQNPIRLFDAKTSRASGMVVSSLIGAAIGCSQTFAILFAHQMMRSDYPDTEEGKAQLSVDIANTAVITPALIPWNASASVPASLLGVGFGFIPYAFLIYLAPLCLVLGNDAYKQAFQKRRQALSKLL